MATAAQKKEISTPQLQEARFEIAEQRRNVFRAWVVQGTNPDACLEEDYWAHTAYMLKQGDLLEMHWEDNTMYAEAIVLSSDRLWAQIQYLAGYPMKLEPPTKQPGEDKYSVGWGGPAHQYRVLSGTDVLKTGFGTKDAAERWMKNHKSNINR